MIVNTPTIRIATNTQIPTFDLKKEMILLGLRSCIDDTLFGEGISWGFPMTETSDSDADSSAFAADLSTDVLDSWFVLLSEDDSSDKTTFFSSSLSISIIYCLLHDYEFCITFHSYRYPLHRLCSML